MKFRQKQQDTGRIRSREDIDGAFFTQLWEDYGKRIACFIVQILPSESAAFDDLFQDVMLRILEHLPSFNRSLPFEAWAFRIARNRCIDHLRNRKQHEPLNEDIPYRTEPVVEMVLRGELDAAIKRSLAVLEPDDRQIAYLRFYENMRNRQIAEVMAMNENTVKTRVVAIKRRLRSELEEWL